ncbi:hypothetical protein QC762_0016620 [Podospora pseudocomata]|uniref:Uncharacterized protein n=1 Tax=Podospora pseudocomata TaxID=2093779 RepID=A0ABR0GX29_9PEZI|nr:hypothetical protein QC762_0016620 [Podospora pseudocomata]
MYPYRSTDKVIILHRFDGVSVQEPPVEFQIESAKHDDTPSPLKSDIRLIFETPTPTSIVLMKLNCRRATVSPAQGPVVSGLDTDSAPAPRCEQSIRYLPGMTKSLLAQCNTHVLVREEAKGRPMAATVGDNI